MIIYEFQNQQLAFALLDYHIRCTKIRTSIINIFIFPTYSQYFCLFNYKKSQDLRYFLAIFQHLIFIPKTPKKPLFQAFFTLSIMCFSQQNHALNMPRPTEHVYRNCFHCFVSIFLHIFQIPCQGFRIAGYIYHLLGF